MQTFFPSKINRNFLICKVHIPFDPMMFQIPMREIRSDAPNNFFGALLCAAFIPIPAVSPLRLLFERLRRKRSVPGLKNKSGEQDRDKDGFRCSVVHLAMNVAELCFEYFTFLSFDRRNFSDLLFTPSSLQKIVSADIDCPSAELVQKPANGVKARSLRAALDKEVDVTMADCPIRFSISTYLHHRAFSSTFEKSLSGCWKMWWERKQEWIPLQVTVFFDGSLYRGNRVTKTSSNSMHAFESPNHPRLVRFDAFLHCELNVWSNPKKSLFPIEAYHL